MMRKKLAMSMARIFIFFLVLTTVVFSAPNIGLCREYIFLLDKSYSMNDSDPQKRAPLAIKAMLGFLKEDDKAAVYAFGTDIEELYPFSFVKNQPNLAEINYEGYTNTGKAAKTAFNALKGESDPKKSVVIVTDGEIMMPTKEGTLISAQEFAAAMEGFSREKIPVYVFTLPMEREEEYSLYSGYAQAIPVTEANLTEKAEEFMRNEVKEPEPIPYAEKTEEVEEESNALPYVLTAIVLGILAFGLWRKFGDFYMNGNALYSGKLIVYITDSDSKPYVYDLLRHGGEKLTFSRILRDLRIFLDFEDTDRLIFSPSGNGVYLLNNSNATVVKNGDILLKGDKFEVLPNERIHLTFEENEVELIYKTLKP